MSINLKGKSCAMCKAYLFEEDDVVFCPICGAPHHRECYERLGHCALEKLHGTENQYNLEVNTQITEEVRPTELVKCSVCGEEYEKEAKSCPSCNAPNFSKMGSGYVVFDLLGGVPKDMELGKGVTANEAKNFVLTNTHRYIPKFALMKTGKKASWNWLAFLFTGPWFFSRKMYKGGFLTTALTIAFSLLQFPFINAVSQILGNDSLSYMEMSNIIAQNLDSIDASLLVAAFISIGLTLVLKLVTGIFGDYFYRNHTLKSVAFIKENSEDKNADFQKRGGVSLIYLMLALMATEYLPGILFTLI